MTCDAHFRTWFGLAVAFKSYRGYKKKKKLKKIIQNHNGAENNMRPKNFFGLIIKKNKIRDGG